MDSATPPPPLPASEKKQTLFDTVVTSTPVLLTVIATFLLGQSSSEMTQAQYHRAVASQNQSKAGDMWGFFQAKRIRGQILEGNADLLLALKRSPFSRSTFADSAQGLVTELREAEKVLVSLANEDAAISGKMNGSRELAGMANDLKALVVEAEKFRASTKSALNPPVSGWKGERQVLNSHNLQAALDSLQGKAKKISKDTKSASALRNAHESRETDNDAEQVVLLSDIISDIKKRKHENEIAPKAQKFNEAILLQAIKRTDSAADEVYRRGKIIEDVLEEFDLLVERQTALAVEYQEIAARLKPLLEPKETRENRQALVPVREALERRADAIRELNARMQGDYKAARHKFTAHRYEDDARSNQESAYLYEVKVLLSSVRSNKHLKRSKMFLFAMLVAQAGVTIATLAMAVKRKSIFWLLAALTGLIAIAFGLYVYLDLMPMSIV